MKLAVLLPMTCIHYHRAALLVLGKLPKHGSRTWPKHCLVQHVLCKLGLPVLTQPISVSNGLALMFVVLLYCGFSAGNRGSMMWGGGKQKVVPSTCKTLWVYGRSVMSLHELSLWLADIEEWFTRFQFTPHAKRMRGDLKLREPSITRSRRNPSWGTPGWLVMNAILVMCEPRSWSMQLQI